VESRDGLPGSDVWLLARRSLSDPTDIAYYLSNAPVDTPLLKLAQVASTRYVVEQLNDPFHTGILPCFLSGRLARLSLSNSRAAMSRGLVSLGAITSSMWPEAAAV